MKKIIIVLLFFNCSHSIFSAQQNASTALVTIQSSANSLAPTYSSANQNPLAKLIQAMMHNALATPNVDQVKDYLIKGSRVPVDKLFALGDSGVMAIFDSGAKYQQESNHSKQSLMTLMHLMSLYQRIGVLDGVIAQYDQRLKEAANRFLQNDENFNGLHASVGNIQGQSKQFEQRMQSLEGNIKIFSTKFNDLNYQLGLIEGAQSQYDQRLKSIESNIATLNNSVLSSFSYANFKEVWHYVEMVSIIGFPTLNSLNKIFNEIPILNKFTNSLEDTFLKILIISTIYRAISFIKKVRGKCCNLSDYKSEIFITFVAFVYVLKKQVRFFDYKFTQLKDLSY